MHLPNATSLKDTLGDEYVIERELGRGGASIVYLADDVRRGGKVAVKILRRELAATISVQRFVREIDVLSKLEHRNILRPIASGATAGMPFYVMPFVSGGTLRDLLERNGALQFQRAIEITQEVAAALDYAHALGIAHRDIKPGNILFDGTRAIVSDFGIAHAFSEATGERLTETGASVGTPAYMSPEQAGNERKIDGRSDIYSLGCVVFEMLAGEPPFTAATSKTVVAKQMHEPPPSLGTFRPTATPAMEQTVARALAKVPVDRFATAGEFARALGSAGSGASVLTRRRVRAGLLASAGALLVLAAAFAVPKLSRKPSTSNDPLADAARRIAVLYFDDLSPDKRLGHVTAGLTEDLIDQLSQVVGLRVISPNGVRPFRENAASIDTVARRLNVGTIITGGVSSSGSTLRLTARLIDAATGHQLHSRTFERPAWDFFKLQDSLTTDVAYSLRERLGQEIRVRERRSAASSVEAWQIVQRAEALEHRATELIRLSDDRAFALMLQADSLFDQAERLDSKWVVPTVGRARNAAFRARATTINGQTDPVLARKGYEVAIAFADRAVARYPETPDALAVRGDARLRMVTEGRVEPIDSLLRLARADLQKAISLRPDFARAWYSLGDLSFEEGGFAEAADAFRTAFETDAFMTDARAITNMLFFSNLSAGKFEEADRWCRDARLRYLQDPRFAECQLTLLGWSGKTVADVAAAWNELAAIERGDTTRMLASNAIFQRMMVAAVLARAGMRDSAHAVIARAHRDSPSARPAPVTEAYVYVLLGDHQQAIRLLADYLVQAPRERRKIARMRWFTNLGADASFRALLSGTP